MNNVEWTENAQILKDCLVHVANAPNSFAKI